MTRVCIGLLAFGFLCNFETLRAQQPIPSVVQLPSFQVFSYSGSVMVPDSGTAQLGGVYRSATSLNRRGRSRSFSSASQNSQLSVTATIIDHNEIDRQLLGDTPQRFLADQRARADQRLDADQRLRGEQGKRKLARKRADPVEEGKSLVRHARKLYVAGNQSAAFDTYLLAIDVLDGRLRELAKDEFRRVFGPAADQSLKMAALRR